MLYKNEIVQNDIKEILGDGNISWEKLKNSSVLITGATGMLARYITYLFIYMNERMNYNIKIYILVRNKEKAIGDFGEYIRLDYMELINQDICDKLYLNDNVDYIIHAAGSCSAYCIKTNPIGIIDANTIGVKNILEYAKNKNVKNILYVSTREIYGEMPENIELIKESDMGILEPQDSRSCYPESKRMGEQIFKAYSDVYGINYNVVRMAHAYGPGMNLKNDGRVMADFMNNTVDGTDIVMKSAGDAQRAFCYITDAVRAMMIVLLNGDKCDSYNVANEDEPMKIREVAQILSDIAGNKIKVIYKQENDTGGYCKYVRVGLDTTKIRTLGWNPKIKLLDGLKRTYNSFIAE
jgi:UDP-glucuronate decarboxylase